MGTSKLDPFWDDFFEQFIRTLLADGYDEFEILDKMMNIFKMVRGSNNDEVVVEKPENPVVETAPIVEANEVEQEISEDATDDIIPLIPKSRRNPNAKPPCEHTNYDKTLSTKFEHERVYIQGAKAESLATIEVGPNNRVRDVYKLVGTGEVYNEHQYLKTFNHYFNPDNAEEWKWRNKARIVFEANPKVHMGIVKSNRYYYKLNSIEDIKNFVPDGRGRKSKTF